MAVRVIKKSLAGSEDLLLGFGTEVQVRNDKNIEITKINASNIPYDETKSISASITKKVDTLADMRAMNELPETVWCSGYHSKNDGAFGSHFYRLKGLKTTETDNSGTVISVSVGGSDYVYELQYDGAVNVKWFGAKGDGITDDTAAFTNTIASFGTIVDTNYPTVRRSILVSAGRYKITSILIPKYTDIFFDGAILEPLDPFSTVSHLVRLSGFTTITNLVIDMNYSITYSSAVHVRGRYNTLNVPIVWRARLAYIVGDVAWVDPSLAYLGDSENIWNGGECNWCVNVMEVYGRNTIIHLTGGIKLYSFKWARPDTDSGAAEWKALPEWIIKNYGGLIYISNSFLGNFSGAVACIISKIQATPPADGSETANKNTYGGVYIDHTHIESGKLFSMENVPGITAYNTSSSVLLSVTNSNGYVSGGNVGYYIDASGLTTQPLIVNNCNFYGNAISSRAIYSFDVPVSYDIASFKNATSSAFRFRNLYKTTNALILSMDSSNSGGTTSETPIIFTNTLGASYSTYFASQWYNSSTGAITPRQTLYNVVINVSFDFKDGALNHNVMFNLNGAPKVALVRTGRSFDVTFHYPVIAAGTAITITFKQFQGIELNGYKSNNIRISADV